MRQPYTEVKFILYVGTNKLRETEIWQMKERKGFENLIFEKGYVYKVTPEVYEYLKGHKSFMHIKGVKDSVIGFGK